MGGGDLPVLLFFLALLALPLYALLLVPFEIRFSGGYEAGEVRGFCAFCWAVVSLRLLWTEGAPCAEVALGRSVLFSTPLGGEEEEEEIEEKTGEEKPAAGPGAREVLAAARAVLPGALNLLGYTLARCRIACGRIRFRAGLDNAADTGILFGIVQAINGVLAPTPFRVDMTPLFDGGEAAGRAEGRVLIERPLTILIAAALFAVSAPVRTAVWPLIRGEA
ncbi:hypothetical protein Metli_0094 [Methanofollis liminatans DSM 4140]|uniref:DUF2953 domain-containing protein n=1 Tax=Methanofollis liminatans DSM 4140 TaxID=28892 RepID=J1KZB6_9EURY|nr:DUF2953 domain-containing protein [Methanofollis liminatans]EJG06072.1 hypothetical protein Metli_0094 [Methanofollis liminatans DSM 4140]